MLDPVVFFKHPTLAGQKQYEALRGYFIDHVPGREVARRFGYTYAAFNSLKQRFKAGALQFQFTAPPGPKGPRVSAELREKIIKYRRQRLSAYQIAEVLDTLGTPLSVSTISRILADEGFARLPRRTQLLIGRTKDNTIVPGYAAELEPDFLAGWRGTCAIGGIFLFAPLLEHFGVIDAIKQAKLPRSPDISALNYTLSMLALKLVGKKRLSQINDFNFDRGLGLFANLNILPKSTAISTYSYRLSQQKVNDFMLSFIRRQNAKKIYGSDTLNLVFCPVNDRKKQWRNIYSLHGTSNLYRCYQSRRGARTQEADKESDSQQTRPCPGPDSASSFARDEAEDCCVQAWDYGHNG
jgi:hypothetical protein